VRRPALGMALAGLALFLALRTGGGPAAPAPTVWLPPGEAARLEAGFLARAGRLPGPAEREALRARRIDQEVLLREALRLGLHLDDPVALRRLVEDARFVSPRLADASPERLLDEALALGLEARDPVVRARLAHRMRHRLLDRALPRAGAVPEPEGTAREEAVELVPERVWIEQRFFGPEGVDARRRAREALALREGGGGVEAARLEQALPLRTRLGPVDRAALARLLGDRFAEAVLALPVGRWRVVPSRHGVHGVRVTRREEAVAPPAALQRARARRAWQGQREAAALEQALATLRLRHPVRFAPDTSPPGSGG